MPIGGLLYPFSPDLMTVGLRLILPKRLSEKDNEKLRSSQVDLKIHRHLEATIPGRSDLQPVAPENIITSTQADRNPQQHVNPGKFIA
ncbi:hypothetical protein U5A82_20635 [Sphingobium sp. CR2-8]|uniref:hypothetical protein n=1 Tax=Sphingobium sp. CR2-8 TaxID=1306534 RepID=UPI002DB7AC37|nr:hypothetical protein [Sphingobium sp. CR2-8]MEC3912791.1 hypothetical protein [Sphingobium sp. CR2-8]